jgi:hypothetical protein
VGELSLWRIRLHPIERRAMAGRFGPAWVGHQEVDTGPCVAEPSIATSLG